MPSHSVVSMHNSISCELTPTTETKGRNTKLGCFPSEEEERVEIAMADLAVGLSKSVVEGALARVQTVIQEDAKLRQKAQRDLVLISLEFEMMQSFLDVANNEMSTTKNKLVRTWVRHVRELANDLEDCIEFIVHLDGRPIFWRRLIPSCIALPLPLDQAVVEIEDLKGRAKELSECYMRYSHITDSTGSKFVMLPQQASSRAAGATASNLLSKARDATRRLGRLGDLPELITKKLGDELQVISVWGTDDDLVTTSIIREAYNDPEICRSFTCRAWVKLTHPFNPHEFVRRFMAQVYANSCQEQGAVVSGVHVLTKMKDMQEHLLEEFVKEVKFKTYLVVLDNLKDMVDWDAVRTFLPDIKNGSTIIVSTQHFEIARLCIGHSYQSLELKQMSHDHSICAVFKEGSQDYGNKKENSMVLQLSQNSSYENTTNYALVGRKSEMNKLRTFTAMARMSISNSVVSVWGIAGTGKSTLVRKFYSDKLLNSDQFRKYLWVDVSHPFNLRDFSRSLILCFHSERLQSLISNYYSKRDPIKECRELLSKYRCFVVIDDLRSKEEWDLIKGALVSRNSSSVIIVITTEASIATHCTNKEDRVINVKGLEADAAMDLFRTEVQRKTQSSSLHDCKHAALEELIFKCGGLPKVIVSIAALMDTEPIRMMVMVRRLNEKFMHHLETNLEHDSLRGLFDWMYNYFRTCPDSLKPCIFYLSIFPRGYNIRRKRLVRRWVAEGYSRDNEEESALDRGENFFSKLIELSIIQPIPQLARSVFSDTRMVVCQVNGFIREYIVSRRMEENLVFELGPDCVLTTKRTGRHLIILDTWDRDRIVFESIDFSRLRSLTVFGKWESFFICKSMRMLRVLDLEDASGVKEEDLYKMVQQMLRLKFLSLRGRSEIFRLPNSLGYLRQLQTLDVRHTSIVTLPASIGNLQKLQYIRAGTKVPASTPAASSSRLPEFLRGRGLVGVKVPREIGKLTALHTLGVLNVGASGGKAIVEKLKKLTQLRKLGVSGINKHNYKDFFLQTSGLKHLESLSVQLDMDNQSCLDQISLPSDNLQSLTLYGLKDTLPLSNPLSLTLYELEDTLPLRNPLSKLSKLDLEMDTLQQNDMCFLADLPELCILHLRVKQIELHFHVQMSYLELESFRKVKILEVTCRSSKLHVTFGSESMKNLELLKIDCSSTSYELTGLDGLSKLKEVFLKGTSDTAIKTKIEEQLINHPNKPTVKLGELPPSS